MVVESRGAHRGRVTLVLDNLNTHTKGPFYRAFERDRARGLARRIKFCFTPMHGSWLNIADCELSARTRQCLCGRRIGDLETQRTEFAAWLADVNRRQRGVEWQTTVDDARRKLKSIHSQSIA